MDLIGFTTQQRSLTYNQATCCTICNMRKAMMVAMTAAALGAGVAGAQSWRSEDGTLSYTYNGCKAANGGVECTVTASYMGSKDVAELQLCTGNMAAVLRSGNSIEPREKRFGSGGTSMTCDTSAIYKGVPLQLGAIFPDVELKDIVKFNFYGKVLNVSAIAPAPAPVAAPAPAQINLAGNWQGTLTNCRAAGNNTYVCSIVIKK